MSFIATKPHSFCSESLRGKSVTDIPGIGPECGSQLHSHGFHKATDVLGKFLTMNEDQFQEWLRDQGGANAKQQGDCYRAMRDWADNNL